MVRLSIPLLVIALFALAPIDASAQTKEDVEKAENAVEYAEARKSRAYQDWVAARDELDAAVEEYELINAERERLTYNISLLYERIQEYEDEVVGLKDRARDLVIEAYTSGGTDLIGAAFEAGSIQDLLTSQVIIDKATSRDIAQLDRFEAIKRDMERLKIDLSAQEADVRELEEQAIAIVERMAELDAQAEAAYASASDDVRAAIDALDRERNEFAAAEARRKAAAAAAARSTATGAAAGLPAGAISGFVCPVAGSPSFINSWGFPRSGGRRHKGVDMFDPRGTPVVAVVNGTVALRTVNLGGISTYLYGDDGNTYYYTHLDGYPSGLSSGQRVSAGEAVGYLGNTGNARYTSPHLHFEIRPGGGAAVNPYPTVRDAC